MWLGPPDKPASLKWQHTEQVPATICKCKTCKWLSDPYLECHEAFDAKGHHDLTLHAPKAQLHADACYEQLQVPDTEAMEEAIG